MSDLYNFLLQVMKEESFVLVRGAGGASGIGAWRAIHQRLISSAPATALTDLVGVISPGRVNNHREVFTIIKSGRFGWMPSVGITGRRSPIK